MENKSKIPVRIFLIILVVSVSGSLIACGGNGLLSGYTDKTTESQYHWEYVPLPADTGKLIAFSYHFGSFNGGYWNYSIFEQNGNYFFEGTGHNSVSLDVRGEVYEQTLVEISELIEENEIKKWHGFSGVNKNVYDGYGYKLEAVFENETLHASGYMLYPPGYETGHQALADYLGELASRIQAPVLTKDSEIQSIGVRIYNGTQSLTVIDFSLYFQYAAYMHGNKRIYVPLSDLPSGVTGFTELKEMVAAYYTLYPGDSGTKYGNAILYLEIDDGIFEPFEVHASATADTEAFNAIVDVMLSYFGLDASYIGSEEHASEE